MKGKIAIITGGESGIGYAIAKALAEAGATFVIADVDAAAGARANDQLQRFGREGLFVKTKRRRNRGCSLTGGCHCRKIWTPRHPGQ